MLEYEYNEATQCWKKKKEPAVVLKFATEEEWEEYQKLVELGRSVLAEQEKRK